MHPIIVWFRRDLRVDDNPALAEACRRGVQVVPVFLWSPHEEAPWAPGGAARWWLHGALEDLESALRLIGLSLVIRSVPVGQGSLDVLQDLARECGAGQVFWNRRYEPQVVQRDTAVKAALRAGGLEVKSFNAHLLFEPWTVATQGGGAYRVFTPFKRSVADRPVDAPLPSPLGPVLGPLSPLSGLTVGALGLRSKLPWSVGLESAWQPTRKGGLALLEAFTKSVSRYARDRDYPSVPGTSRLSPYLAWGQLGVREVVARLQAQDVAFRQSTYWSELLWREFAHHVLHHFPETPESPLQASFQGFPWQSDAVLLSAWQRGQTGYPIVDAGMRQLWRTGWMHNRVRMIVGSLLVKHLLQPWSAGAAWFWDTLVDADLANNTLGWQWVGGCGADAAPYFRVFNPTLQGEKFDVEGAFVRAWVPELERLPVKFIHRPWEAPGSVLRPAGLHLGAGGYPRPVVEHTAGRARALEAFARLRRPPRWRDFGFAIRLSPLPFKRYADLRLRSAPGGWLRGRAF